MCRARADQPAVRVGHADAGITVALVGIGIVLDSSPGAHAIGGVVPVQPGRGKKTSSAQVISSSVPTYTLPSGSSVAARAGPFVRAAARRTSDASRSPCPLRRTLGGPRAGAGIVARAVMSDV